MVEFGLLGPVRMWSGQHPIEIGEPRRRAVLAALLVDADRVVSTSTLVYRVWGEDPPGQVLRTLGAHVTRIRRILEQADEPVSVVRQHGGYALRAPRDQVDLHRFRWLVAQSRAPRCADRRRVGLLRRALDLWHGDALAGIPGEWAQRTREHLGHDRLEAVACWADAQVRLGDPSPAVAPLAELAELHPLMEPLTLLLMRALVALGRPTEALERCRAHRERIADSYGTDQSRQLRDFYDSILRHSAG